VFTPATFATSFFTGPTLTGLATLIVALTGLLGVILNRKTTKNVQQDVADVHTLVNSHANKQDRRIDQLSQQLTEAGHTPDPRPPNGVNTPT
jgi:hypothetical protein